MLWLLVVGCLIYLCWFFYEDLVGVLVGIDMVLVVMLVYFKCLFE